MIISLSDKVIIDRIISYLEDLEENKHKYKSLMIKRFNDLSLTKKIGLRQNQEFKKYAKIIEIPEETKVFKIVSGLFKPNLENKFLQDMAQLSDKIVHVNKEMDKKISNILAPLLEKKNKVAEYEKLKTIINRGQDNDNDLNNEAKVLLYKHLSYLQKIRVLISSSNLFFTEGVPYNNVYDMKNQKEYSKLKYLDVKNETIFDRNKLPEIEINSDNFINSEFLYLNNIKSSSLYQKILPEMPIDETKIKIIDRAVDLMRIIYLEKEREALFIQKNQGISSERRIVGKTLVNPKEYKLSNLNEINIDSFIEQNLDLIVKNINEDIMINSLLDKNFEDFNLRIEDLKLDKYKEKNLEIKMNLVNLKSILVKKDDELILKIKFKDIDPKSVNKINAIIAYFLDETKTNMNNLDSVLTIYGNKEDMLLLIKVLSSDLTNVPELKLPDGLLLSEGLSIENEKIKEIFKNVKENTVNNIKNDDIEKYKINLKRNPLANNKSLLSLQCNTDLEKDVTSSILLYINRNCINKNIPLKFKIDNDGVYLLIDNKKEIENLVEINNFINNTINSVVEKLDGKHIKGVYSGKLSLLNNNPQIYEIVSKELFDLNKNDVFDLKVTEEQNKKVKI